MFLGLACIVFVRLFDLRSLGLVLIIRGVFWVVVSLLDVGLNFWI